MNVQVFTISQTKGNALRLLLLEKGFSEKTSQATFCLQGAGICCTMYNSGKLVIQGKSSHLEEFIEFTLEPFLEDFSYTFQKLHSSEEPENVTRIGTDEAGKGDLFGPLCVAAVHVTPELAQFFTKEGIRDSKKLSDHNVKLWTKLIVQKCPHKILSLVPKSYNRLYDQFHNLNRLMEWAHAKIAVQLIQEHPAKKIVVDQFNKHKAPLEQVFDRFGLAAILEQKVRAESDCAVAAASILARNAFITWIETTSSQLHVHIHKGAGPPAQNSLCSITKSLGKEILPDIAKMHFKPVQKAWQGSEAE